MRYIIIIAILLACCLQGHSQKGGYSDHYYQENDPYGTDYWYTSNNLYGISNWGVSSLYWGVTRSEYTDSRGRYRYKVWLLSNSYVWNYYTGVGEWRYTYAWNVSISIGNSVMASDSDGFSFKELYSPSSLTFYSTNSQPYLYLNAYQKVL